MPSSVDRVGTWHTACDSDVCPACKEYEGMHMKRVLPPHPRCTNPLGCRCVVRVTCADCGEQHDARLPHECRPVKRPEPGLFVPVIPVTLEAQWEGAAVYTAGAYMMTLPAAPRTGDVVVWSTHLPALHVRRVAFSSDGLTIDTDPVERGLSDELRARMQALGWAFTQQQMKTEEKS